MFVWYLLDSSLKANTDLFREHVDVYLPVFSILFPFELLISNSLFLRPNSIVPSTHRGTIPAFEPLSIKCYHMEGREYCWSCHMLAIMHYKSNHKWHQGIKVFNLIRVLWTSMKKSETMGKQNILCWEHVCENALSVPYIYNICLFRVKWWDLRMLTDVISDLLVDISWTKFISVCTFQPMSVPL